MGQSAAKPRAAESPATRATPLGRRERAKAEKRHKIVEAARYLFLKNGFDATTTSQIAERADIGSGTLFIYAPTKEDLLIMVFHDEIMEVSRQSFAGVPADRPLIDQLMHVFGHMITYHGHDIALHHRITRLLLDTSSEGRRADMLDRLALVYGGLGDLLTAKVEAGEVRASVNPDEAARMLFSIYYMTLLMWLAGLCDRAACLPRLEGELRLAIDGLGTR